MLYSASYGGRPLRLYVARSRCTVYVQFFMTHNTRVNRQRTRQQDEEPHSHAIHHIYILSI